MNRFLVWAACLAIAVGTFATGFFVGRGKEIPTREPRNETSSEHVSPVSVPSLPSAKPLPQPPTPKANETSHEPLPKEELNELGDYETHLVASLQDGTLTSRDVLERFLKEEDFGKLESMVAALHNNYPPNYSAWRDPVIISRMLQIARGDALQERRVAAMLFLSWVEDPQGEVRDILAQKVFDPADSTLRRGAVSALSTYAGWHPGSEPYVNEQLLRAAACDPDSDNRYHAIASLCWEAANEQLIHSVKQIAYTELTPDVRAVVYESMGVTPTGLKGTLLSFLQEALVKESEDYVRKAALTSLVRAGRAEALPILKQVLPSAGTLSQDVEDFIQILSKDDRDWERIENEKRQLEYGRGS